MKAGDFAAWLSAILGMNEGQRTEAIAALEKASAVGAEGEVLQRGAASLAAKRTRWERPASSASRLRAVLIARAARALGPLARTFAVSLQELRAHLQCADQDADGASAQEGEMARSSARDDRGQKPGQDRGALRRPSDDAVSLATSVSARPRKRQAPRLKRDR
jgi:hypothetical protein